MEVTICSFYVLIKPQKRLLPSYISKLLRSFNASKFQYGYRVQQTPEDGWRVQRPKSYEYNKQIMFSSSNRKACNINSSSKIFQHKLCYILLFIIINLFCPISNLSFRSSLLFTCYPQLIPGIKVFCQMQTLVY